MKHLATLCLIFFFSNDTAGQLEPPERPYKILMLMPVSSPSHRNVFVPLAEALADRGHEIVLLSNSKKPLKHSRIQDINHELTEIDNSNFNMFDERKNGNGGFSVFKTILPAVARKLYNIPVIKELYAKRKEFDVVFTDHAFNELSYPFAHEMPFITVATPGLDARHIAVMGNPVSPAYLPGIISTDDLSTFLGRFFNTITSIFVAIYWRNWAIMPLVQKEIDQHFPNIPLLLDIERNQSLTLLNTHFSMDRAYPLLPNQVEVGGMHCRPGKPLPKDIQDWIDGAGSAGVIYFSLGSVARGQTMPVQYRDMFVEAFKKLKQRVLWKFESEVKEASKNVMIRSWMPQQDILAHPNVKVFITHGGLLSLQEASYHGTPMLALPIFGDQPRNGIKIASKGIGITLVWEELTVDKIVESLMELQNNPKYKNNIEEISRSYQDQLETPIERAVFWTEYVIRHKGAPKLRSPAADLSWVEFLLLDVIAVFLFMLIFLVFVIRWIIKAILLVVFGSSTRNKGSSTRNKGSSTRNKDSSTRNKKEKRN